LPDLCHECGEPLTADGKCPQRHVQCQRCPDPDGIRAACEAIRAGWTPHRLAINEGRSEALEVDLVRRIYDGMRRKNQLHWP
jgi:hypothetical protein